MRVALLVTVLSASAAVPAGPLPVFVPRLDDDGFPLPREAVRRLGSAKFLVGHCSRLAWSPDGKTVFVSGDGVSAWDVTTGKCRWRASGIGEVRSLAVSTEGKVVWVVESRYANEKHSCNLLRLDATTGAKLSERTLRGEFTIHAQVTASGRAVVSDHELLEVFDPNTEKPGYVRKTSPDAQTMSQRELSPDGEWLLVAEPLRPDESVLYRVVLIQLKTGKVMQELKFPAAEYIGLRFSPDSATFTVTHQGGYEPSGDALRWLPTTVTHRDIKTGKELRAAEVARRGVPVSHAPVVSPDGTRAVYTINDAPVLLDATTWKRLRTIDIAHHSDAVAFSPDGKTLAVGGRTIMFVDVATGKPRHDTAPFGPWGNGFRFTDGGDTVVQGYGVFGQVRYNVATAKRTVVRDDAVIDLPGCLPTRDRDGLRQANVVADPNLPKGDPRRGAIQLHAVGRPGVVRELPSAAARQFDRLSFSPGGRYIIGEQRFQATVAIWDTTANAKPVVISWDSPDASATYVSSTRVAACPRERLIAVREYNSQDDDKACTWALGIYELGTGKLAKRLTGSGVIATSLAWSADGTRLAFSGDPSAKDLIPESESVFVFDFTANRYVLESSKRTDGVGTLSFSSDGRTLLCSTGEGIELVEVATGIIRRRFAAGGVTAIAAHPDGRHIATESGTDGVLLWDTLSSPPAWPGDPGTLWDALGREASPAHAALRTLVANPDKALPLLKGKIADLKPISPERVAALVGQLGDKAFATREAASKELLTHLDDARPALKTVVADAGTTAEAKARASNLLARVAPNTPDRLRTLRAVEAVELIGTPDAVTLLRAWSAGTGFRATEAAAALARRAK